MKHCLLVDDLPEALALMDSLLTDVFPDAVQVHASSLAQALEAAERQSFNLALIDLALGDGSGIDLINWLSQHQPDCISVVSTIFDDERLIAALKAGAQGYVLKGQPHSLVVRQLQGISLGQPPLSPAIARRLIRYFHEHAEAGTEASKLLSEREKEVLGLLAKGLRLADIGCALGISRYTVGDHVKSIYQKLNINSRAEAALEARRLGLA